MRRREWRLTALVLGCLALLSAGMTAWVLVRERPENVAAFETRFLDLSGLAFEAQDGLLMEVQPEALTIRWEAGGTEPLRAAVTAALEPGASGATLTVYASGQQNALAGERCGCSWAAVERNIRTTVQRVWRINPQGLIKMAGYPLAEPPTASDFIEIVAHYLRRTIAGEKYAATPE